MKKRKTTQSENNLIPILIFLLILIPIIIGLISLVNGISNEAIEQKRIQPYVCTKTYHLPGKKNIILRIDDIQAYYLNNLQIKMINDALSMGISPSVAVIPFKLSEDKKIFDYLKKNHCKIEIMLHGYRNNDYEFKFLLYSSADERIKKGLKELKKIEPEIMTFVPPSNELSKDSERAVYNNNIKIISANSEKSKYGFTVSTFNWDTYKLRNYKEVIEKCRESLNKTNKCIIMTHPQDFATNEKLDLEKYSQYTNLLSEIKKTNAKVVNFRDLIVPSNFY